ncbi:FAD binding domain-containing protein [Pterulicium gracile]|uniref:FAD binding domain-containing protein n=1 Tax=Pterulicium gracile TaxID=1884261 RepID=A0A5C3Q6G2_9AGAR|nr:FAD binding domain-containing protein [Pterula gracilis]
MKDGLSISLVLLLAVVANAQTASFDEVRDVFGEAASQHEPFSAPCFQDWDSAECITIRTNYLSGSFRTRVPSSMVQTQWETCQRSGEQCLLDASNPNNRPAVNQMTCARGSVPDYFVQVSNYSQVQEAFQFSRDTGVPILVKNTGHDYLGRSSGRGSLSLWTHNLKQIAFHRDFKAEGCSKTYETAITIGAGVQFTELYAFADANNVTVIGGEKLLGGGGHGPLTNTLGMAADRALQFRVVTPDGQYRTVNACQNEDLFIALRGGGGGFAVILEMTYLATPRVTLQAIFLSFPGTPDTTKELFFVLIDNGLRWSQEGWGGFTTTGVFIYINPVLNATQAVESMTPIAELSERLKTAGVTNVSLTQATFPSYLSWYRVFFAANIAAQGINMPFSSRLVPKTSFATAESRAELLAAYEAAYKITPRLIIHSVTPASYAGDGQTSMTPAWRNSVFHTTMVDTWRWNATRAEKLAGYRKVGESADHLRRITPDASYSNEADIYEPNHKVAHWGSNYDKLLSIKNKYDPERLLDCWHCVGFDPSSPRFGCYFSEAEVKGR